MKVTIGPYPELYDHERQIDIQIDPYDSWNADYTLALIIVPLLEQLRATTHGSCEMQEEDVPDHLKDADVHEIWDWALGEMIWSMKQLTVDDWESEIFDNYWVEGADNQDKWKEEYTKINERIQRGNVLFGKYFRALWD